MTNQPQILVWKGTPVSGNNVTASRQSIPAPNHPLAADEADIVRTNGQEAGDAIVLGIRGAIARLREWILAEIDERVRVAVVGPHRITVACDHDCRGGGDDNLIPSLVVFLAVALLLWAILCWGAGMPAWMSGLWGVVAGGVACMVTLALTGRRGHA